MLPFPSSTSLSLTKTLSPIYIFIDQNDIDTPSLILTTQVTLDSVKLTIKTSIANIYDGRNVSSCRKKQLNHTTDKTLTKNSERIWIYIYKVVNYRRKYRQLTLNNPKLYIRVTLALFEKPSCFILFYLKYL